MSKVANRDLWKADIAWGGDGTGMGAHQPQARVKRARDPSKVTETQEQRALIQWWDVYAKTKGLDNRLLFAIPNGAFLGRDPRSRVIQMAVLKSTGLRPGVSDLMLAVPKPPHAGLFVEMKSVDGGVRPDQLDFRDLVREQGFKAEICYGADEAIETIKGYLG